MLTRDRPLRAGRGQTGPGCGRPADLAPSCADACARVIDLDEEDDPVSPERRGLADVPVRDPVDRPGWVAFQPFSAELRQRPGVPIRIGEPGDLVSVWRSPHAVLVLLHAGVSRERHALHREFRNAGLDVACPPAQHGVASGPDLGDRRNPATSFRWHRTRRRSPAVRPVQAQGFARSRHALATGRPPPRTRSSLDPRWSLPVRIDGRRAVSPRTLAAIRRSRSSSLPASPS
jgi:hypothetical protein